MVEYDNVLKFFYKGDFLGSCELDYLDCDGLYDLLKNDKEAAQQILDYMNSLGDPVFPVSEDDWQTPETDVTKVDVMDLYNEFLTELGYEINDYDGDGYSFNLGDFEIFTEEDEFDESYKRENRNELHHYFDDLDPRFAFDLDDEFEIYVGNKLVPCKVVDSTVYNKGEGLTYTIVTAIDGDDAHWQMDDWVQRGLDEFFKEETDGSDYAYGLWETTDELYNNGDYPENGENTRWYVTDVDVYPVVSDWNDDDLTEGCGSRKKSKKKKIINQGCGSKKIDESAGVPSESQFVNAYTWSYGTTKAKAKQVYKDCKKDGDIEYIKAIVDGFEGNAKKSFYNDSKKPKKIAKESGKRKYTQRDIKDYVAKGMATDITHYSFDEANKFYKDHNYDVVGISHGTYGMNGALLQDVDTGEYFAITARNSTLFQLV